MTFDLVAGAGLGREAALVARALSSGGRRVALVDGGRTDDPGAALAQGRARLALIAAETAGAVSEELCWAAVPKRPEPRDALVPRDGDTLSLRSLASGSRVGVAGARRNGFLRAHRPDVEAVALGNGGGPAAALGAGRVDALILGAAEARRSLLEWRATELLDPRAWVPGARQGALVLLARAEDQEACRAAAAVEDRGARAALAAESAVLRALRAPADAPVGVLALPHGRRIRIWAMAVSVDGRAVVRGDLTGGVSEPEAVGRALAHLLIERGVDQILDEGT